MSKKKSRLLIGTSGFSYKHWFGDVFYPDEIEEPLLTYYAKKFNSVELNVSFYRLPPRKDFKKWDGETPEDFVFAVKGSRFITHIKRLNVEADAVKKFFDAASGLGKKFEVVLWQLPSNFKKDIERLEKFLKLLRGYKVRQAFEFRHEDWFSEDVYQILRKENAGLVYIDSNKWPQADVATADFTYVRMHGGSITYATKYTDKELKDLSKKMAAWKRNGDVYLYFNNDAYAFAVENAMKLRDLIAGGYTKR